MPSHDFTDLGDVLDYDILKGTIIDVNSSDDTCTVRLVGESGAKTALLFYH